ncbi:MAG TPA: pitrilysin family protein [Bacteroidia bacterium]|nr:pitrilysin family protein [Bacteroidia bacterium]
MKRLLIFLSCIFIAEQASAFVYPVFDTLLANGLKVIVCEKPATVAGEGFAELEVWYRVGSKDEKDGTRGMAHLFEHMMFRGTKNYSGETFTHRMDSVGAEWNAYTTFDRTVYHEFLPVAALDMAMMLEADRMQNLDVTQEILDTEREVVGQEYRNGISNWYRKMQLDRYAMLYPQGHPYAVDVIGNLDEVTSFTSEQCMKFYNEHYSPGKAFVIIVGDVKHSDVFKTAAKTFGAIYVVPEQIAVGSGYHPMLNTHVKGLEMNMDFPLQIYCFSFPQPPASDKDFFAFDMIMSVLFSDDNSILNERLVKEEHSAFGVVSVGEAWSLFPSRTQVDVFMPPSPGNLRVKKAIREEIDDVIANGLPQEKMNDFISNLEASQIMGAYYAENIAHELGMAEYYFRDYKKADTMIDSYKAVTQEDIKRVAGDYMRAEQVDVINIKPAE